MSLIFGWGYDKIELNYSSFNLHFNSLLAQSQLPVSFHKY